MMRSSTVSCASLAAYCGVMPGLNAVTFEAMLGAGTAGRTHTRADPETGARFPTGGSAAEASLEIQSAVAGPLPTLSGTVGVEPSASPAAGCALGVPRSGAIATHPTQS